MFRSQLVMTRQNAPEMSHVVVIFRQKRVIGGRLCGVGVDLWGGI